MFGMRRINFAAIFALPVLALACGDSEEKQAIQDPVVPAIVDATPAEAEPVAAIPVETSTQVTEYFSKVSARLKVLDLDGQPILGMAPIATRQANAFDEPVAIGALSNKEGITEFEFPGDQKLYIRAWDPDGRMFANNFFDAVPNTGNVSDELQIQMAPGAIVAATVLDANKTPLADTKIELLLSHPTAGEWWPAKGTTDTSGKLKLGPVPPGKFTINLKSGSGLKLELPATFLPPAETVELGTLTLQ